MASDYSLELDLPAESMGEIQLKVSQAIRKVLRRAVAWLRVESLKRLSQELGIKQATLKDRFKIRLVRTGEKASLWIGILPLSAIKIGAARQQKDGVKVRDYFFHGAFLKTVHSERAIWKRDGSDRYPVKKQTVDFSDDAIEIISQLESQLNRKFSNWMSEALA